jgi:hypothetical protein
MLNQTESGSTKLIISTYLLYARPSVDYFQTYPQVRYRAYVTGKNTFQYSAQLSLGHNPAWLRPPVLQIAAGLGAIERLFKKY